MAEEYLGDYLSFIKESERLKTVLRTAWLSDGSRESTAAHSWRLALLRIRQVPFSEGIFPGRSLRGRRRGEEPHFRTRPGTSGPDTPGN